MKVVLLKTVFRWCAIIGAIAYLCAGIKRTVNGLEARDLAEVFLNACGIAFFIRCYGSETLADSAKAFRGLEDLLRSCARFFKRSSDDLSAFIEEEELKVPEYERITDDYRVRRRQRLFARTKSFFSETTVIKIQYAHFAIALLALCAIGWGTKEIFTKPAKNEPAYSGPFAPRYSPESEGTQRGVGGAAVEAPDVVEAEALPSDSAKPKEIIPLPRPRPLMKSRETRDPWKFPQL